MPANNRLRLLALLLYAAMLYSCAALPGKKEPSPPSLPPVVEKMPLEEQETIANQKFEQLLDMIIESGDRNAILPEIMAVYDDIIANYPDTYLAQESYWRLIIMSLNDFFPPKTEDAERYYREFAQKYPDSKLRYAIDDTMARFYYSSGIWDKLEEFCSPYIRKYVKSGSLENPLFIFFYSEAKFNLGDYVEADKGYRTVVRFFPSSQESTISLRRLEEIHKRKNVQNAQ